jgi:glycosyltransferase involved in cell wall biosynthesis
MTTRLRMAIVVPFLDEERHLPEVLDSLARQTRPPDQLLLVDDGSSDRSAALAATFAARYDWAELAHRPPRAVGRDRLAGGSALAAFAWGVARLAVPWDVVAKVDGDLALAPTTLATLESAFLRDPALGLAGPFVSVAGPDARLRRQRLPRDQVHGATKFYRRPCWEAIAPLPAILGWDTIDVMRARVQGWRTRSFEIPGGDPVHLRPMGTHDGLLRAYRRWGRCAWGFGDHPAHMLATAFQRLGDHPRGLGSLNYCAGWLTAAVTGAPRAEPELRAYVHRDELRRLRLRLLGRPTRPLVEAE